MLWASFHVPANYTTLAFLTHSNLSHGYATIYYAKYPTLELGYTTSFVEPGFFKGKEMVSTVTLFPGVTSVFWILSYSVNVFSRTVISIQTSQL